MFTHHVRGRRTDSGFTLVELLVVITILGILAAVVIAAVSGIGDKGRESAVKTDASILATAQEASCARNTHVHAEEHDHDEDSDGYLDTPQLQSAGFLSSQPQYNDVDMDPASGGTTCGDASYALFTPRRTDYPVSVTGCGGRRVTFAEKPERPVTMDAQAYELMLWLGLDEAQYAAYPQEEGARPEQFRESASDNLVRTPVPGAVIVPDGGPQAPADWTVPLAGIDGVNPDLVIGVQPSAFADNAGFTRTEEAWDTTGVATYFGHSYGLCADEVDEIAEGHHHPRTTFEGTYDDLRNLGIIFDVQAEALEVISRMKSAVADSIAKARTGGGHRVGTAVGATPVVFGGNSAANALIDQLGAQNVWEEQLVGYGGPGLPADLAATAPSIVILTGYATALDPSPTSASCAAARAGFDAAAPYAAVPAAMNDRYVCIPYELLSMGGVRLATEGLPLLVDELARG